MWLDADQCGGICDNFPDPLSLTRCCCCHVDILFFANLDIYSCFWQNSSFDKWAGFSQVWCHCCSPAIVRQTFRGSGNVTEDQQLSRALPEEDMTRTNDMALITLPLSYHRHTIGKDFTQVIEIFQPMREYWGVRYCSLFAPLWAVWGNLRLFVGSCPNSYRPPSVMPTSALPKALSFKSFSHHKWEASRWKTKPLRRHIMTEKLFNWPKSVIIVFLC